MRRLVIGPEHPNSLNRQWRSEYRAKRYLQTLTLDGWTPVPDVHSIAIGLDYITAPGALAPGAICF